MRIRFRIGAFPNSSANFAAPLMSLRSQSRNCFAQIDCFHINCLVLTVIYSPVIHVALDSPVVGHRHGLGKEHNNTIEMQKF